MKQILADRYLYLDEAGERVLEQGDPDSFKMLCNPGALIHESLVTRHGLTLKDDKLCYKGMGEVPEPKQSTGSVPITGVDFDKYAEKNGLVILDQEAYKELKAKADAHDAANTAKVATDYRNMKQSDLRNLCKERELELPKSPSNDDMATLLEAYDAESSVAYTIEELEKLSDDDLMKVGTRVLGSDVAEHGRDDLILAIVDAQESK